MEWTPARGVKMLVFEGRPDLHKSERILRLSFDVGFPLNHKKNDEGDLRKIKAVS